MLAQLRRWSGGRGGSKRERDWQPGKQSWLFAWKLHFGESVKRSQLRIPQNLLGILDSVVGHVIFVEDFHPVRRGFGTQEIGNLAFQAGTIAAAFGV